MRIKTLMMTVLPALVFFALPAAAHAQKDGEAQAVSFDENKHPTLKFSNKRADRQRCGAYVSHTLLDNQEEAFVVRVLHMHSRVRIWGGVTFPERGLLYVTPGRVIFTVEAGDKSHGFDVPRTDLKDKPVTKFLSPFAGVQINLKERLAASDSREQKFVFLIYGDKKCNLANPTPYVKFLERAVNDFNGALAEFKQLAVSLEQSGRVEEAREFVTRLNTSDKIKAVLANDITLPSFPTVSPDPGEESHVDDGVEITSEPAGAEIYVDGKLNGRTPSKIVLSAGEHTIKVTRFGYKDWEQKITVEQGNVKTFNAILEKQ